MLRELRFMEDKGDSRLMLARAAGWTSKRLTVLCGLNSFYQLVLGPLASSARDRYGVLGREVPILYGESLRFDERRSSELRGAHAAFMSALHDVPDAPRLLTAPHANDLVYRLAKSLERSDDV